MNDKEQRDIPEDFDPHEYEDYLTELGRDHTAFIDKQEQNSINIIRKNIRILKSKGVQFNDEIKMGFVTDFAIDEAKILWKMLAMKETEDAIGMLNTILSVLYKNILEKVEAEDAVFGITTQEDESK